MDIRFKGCTTKYGVRRMDIRLRHHYVKRVNRSYIVALFRNINKLY